MLSAQSIYGPHDSAQWHAGSVALGRCLFRLLPEDVHDHQPLVGGEGRFVLVADIRLDNRDELIGELRIAPSQARSMADSAILLSAWERWQENCFDRLYGDYAVAVFDRNLNRLTLARDPTGSRPLHYHRGAKFFAFASMPKGLHAHSEVPRLPDQERMAEFLALLPESGPRSFFRDVCRVESGCFVTVAPAGLTVTRHWNPRRRTLTLANADAYAEAMRHHLDQAVRVRLRGVEGAVGAHLSSGFDSSSVAASAALIMAGQGGRVVAFTSVPREGYDGPIPPARLGDEGPIAAKTAARYPNMDHVLVRTAGHSPFDSLDRNFFLFERPVLNLCNLTWSDAINDEARARGLRVLLTGQMGNMTISYDGMTLLSDLVRRGRWLQWLREATGVVRHRHRRVRGMLAQSFGQYIPTLLWKWLSRMSNGVSSDLSSYSAIRPELLKDIKSTARARALDLHYRPRSDGFETRLWVMRRVDLGNYNKGTLGGWGLDQRDPTSDRRLLEFCLSVPEDQFLVRGDTKALARRAFADRLPTEVIAMRGKGLQAIDWHENLTAARGQLTEELDRLGASNAVTQVVDVPRLVNLATDWPEGGWETERVTRKYRLALLRAVSSGHFLRRASGSNT